MTATSSPSQIFITQSNLSPILRSHCLTRDIGTVVLSDDLLLEFKDSFVSSPIFLLVGIRVYIHPYCVYLLVYIHIHDCTKKNRKYVTVEALVRKLECQFRTDSGVDNDGRPYKFICRYFRLKALMPINN